MAKIAIPFFFVHSYIFLHTGISDAFRHFVVSKNKFIVFSTICIMHFIHLFKFKQKFFS